MKQLSTQEIVERSVGKSKFKSTYAGLHHLLNNSNKYRMMRENNTLFLLHILDKGVCHMEMLNADPPNVLFRNILGFTKAMRKANYKRLYFNTDNKKLLTFLQHSGINVKHVSNNKYMVEE